MARVLLYIATSLDGYIARSDGTVDWLSLVDREDEDYGYETFYESIDALVMGSKTYAAVLALGAWAYPGKKSFVLTQQAWQSDRDEIEFLSDPVDQAFQRISAEGFQRIWLVGGGRLTQACLDQDLIDDYLISMLPILLGAGIPLFPSPHPEQVLNLVSAKTYPSGLVQLHYQRQR